MCIRDRAKTEATEAATMPRGAIHIRKMRSARVSGVRQVDLSLIHISEPTRPY